MGKSIGIDQLLDQIENLDYESKLNLLEKFVLLLKKSKSDPNTRLTDLNGLGSDIWKGIDIDNYLSQERQWD